jgi:hypothetical protein
MVTEKERFQTTTAALAKLGEWLADRQVSRVAMEATGVCSVARHADLPPLLPSPLHSGRRDRSRAFPHGTALGGSAPNYRATRKRRAALYGAARPNTLNPSLGRSRAAVD